MSDSTYQAKIYKSVGQAGGDVQVHASGSEQKMEPGSKITNDGTQASAIVDLTDSTGGTANDTLAALGGITALTDNSAGSANNTIEAMPDPTDTPATADALRDDLVAVLLPAIRNNFADVAAKVNAINADMDDAKNNFADLAAKVNAILAALRGVGIIAS